MESITPVKLLDNLDIKQIEAITSLFEARLLK